MPWWAAWCVFVVVAAGTIATRNDYGITIDEHVALDVNRAMRRWFALVVTDPGSALQADAIRDHWMFSTFRNRHLPVYAIGANLCRLACGGMVDDLSAYRIFPGLMLGIAAAVVFAAMAREAGWVAGLGSAAALVLVPRVFGHAHLCAPETTLASLCLVSAAAWWWGGDRWARAWVFALAMGLALATKFTAYVFPLPMVVWVVLGRRWAWWRGLVLAAVVTPLVVWALVPPWWHAPVSGFATYLRDALDPSGRHLIHAYYLGATYRETMPWHNALVLTGLTLPAVHLAGLVVGLVVWAVRRDRPGFVSLCVLCALAMIGVRSWPGTPGHDGVRLFLVAFYFLTPVIGLGLARVVSWAHALGRGWAAVPVAAGLVGWSVYQVGMMHPCELSYYNEPAGGLRGAADTWGMEVTYWFEGVNDRLMERAGALLPPGARVGCFPYFAGYEWYQQRGSLRADIQLDAREPFAAPWLMLGARKSWWHASPAWRIYRTERPVLALRRDGVIVWALYDRRRVAQPPPAVSLSGRATESRKVL